jgi:hypothetical protein
MTDISNRAIIPQVNEPLGYVDGKPLYPTVAWQQFLDALWKRTGGFRDGLYDEVIRSLVEASETRGALASVESLTRALESLAQANDADIRQAIEASRQEASSRIDDARAQTLSSALETIESVRQETLARAADARAETLSSALELIEAARREIRAEAESTRAEVQSALAALGELSRRDIVNDGELAPTLIIRDGNGNPVLNRQAGTLFVTGEEVYSTVETGTHGSAIVIDNDPLTEGPFVVRKLLLPSIQKLNEFSLIESFIEITGNDVGSYLLQVIVVPGSEAELAIGADLFPLGGVGALGGAVVFDPGAISVNSSDVLSPTQNQVNVFINSARFNIPDSSVAGLGPGYAVSLPSSVWVYLIATRTSGDPGSSLTIGTDTNVRVTSILNRAVTVAP